MWPLFTERWGAWRMEALGLPPVPWLDSVQRGDGGSVTGGPLPRATPLLYGFSELAAPRSGHWPDSVRVTGFWLQAHLRARSPL
jgi:hypothetical protein